MVVYAQFAAFRAVVKYASIIFDHVQPIRNAAERVVHASS